MESFGTPPDVNGLVKTRRTIKVITCAGYVACGLRVTRLSSITWNRAAVTLNAGLTLLTYVPHAILVMQKKAPGKWSKNNSLVTISTTLICVGEKVLDISEEVC